MPFVKNINPFERKKTMATVVELPQQAVSITEYIGLTQDPKT